MIGGNIFGKRNSFAFNRVENDERWFAPDSLGPIDGVDQLPDVVPVGGKNLPAERTPFFIQIGDAKDVFRAAGRLNLVLVEEGRQVIHLEIAGRHRGFPELTFRLFAVAHDHINPAGPPVEP